MTEKKYYLLFVEEGPINPKYEGWTAGRMEILLPDEWPYSIDEVSFFTPRNEEWAKFVEKWEGQEIDKTTLDHVIKMVKEKFYLDPRTHQI